MISLNTTTLSARMDAAGNASSSAKKPWIKKRRLEVPRGLGMRWLPGNRADTAVGDLKAMRSKNQTGSAPALPVCQQTISPLRRDAVKRTRPGGGCEVRIWRVDDFRPRSGDVWRGVQFLASRRGRPRDGHGVPA